MTDPDRPPSVPPFATAFESSPTPALALAGAPQRVIALNAAARTVLGDPTDEPLTSALPGAGRALYDACERVARTGRPERAASAWDPASPLQAPSDVFLAPWRGAPGDDGGLVAHFPGLGEEPRDTHTPPSGLVEAALPADVPLLPGLDVAAAYVLGRADGVPRGDWFDVWPLGPSTAAVSIGDVVGRGDEAVTAMVALRAVLRERLAAGVDVSEAVAAADRLARGLPAASGASACVLVVDLAQGTVHYCTAGHPPPLMVDGVGPASFLEPTGAPLLGAGGTSVPASATVRLAEGAALLLYTDGTVFPGRDSGERAAVSGVADLAAAMTRSAQGRPGAAGVRWAERLCEELLQTRLSRRSGAPDGAWDDDVALVALHRLPPVAGLRLDLERAPGSVPRVREELARWLDRLGVRDLDEFAVQQVTTELVANAVQHPAAPGDHQDGGRVRVGAELVPGSVVVTVSDPGPWIPPLPGGDGHGLELVRELAEQVQVDHPVDGTVVRAHVRASRPIGLSRVASAGLPARRQPLSIEDGPGGTIRVSGAVDLVSRDALRAGLLAAGRGGGRSLDVDLSAVSFLDSAAVRTLLEVSGWRLADQPSIRLLAAPGSRAHHVLSTAGLQVATPVG